MTSKQDRQGARTAADLEQKYHFGRMFQKLEEGIKAVAAKATEGIAQLKEYVDEAIAVIKKYTDDADAVIKKYVDTTASQTKAYADTADEAVKAYAKTIFSNPNLLDNWYFPNAVNQRGAESYWSEGFTIDRWKFGLYQSSGAYVYPTKSDVTLHNETATGTACSCYLEQTLENPKHLAGKTVTFSAKLRSTTTVAGDPILRIYTNKRVYKSGYIRTSDAGKIVTLTATLPADLTALSVGIGAYASYGGDGSFNLAIESMKLELGSVSTLVNDAPPKKSEQLLECQRYYIRVASEGGQWLMGASNGTTLYAPLHLPVPLRAFPVLEGENKGFKYANVNIYPYVSGGKVEVTSLTLAGASGTQDFVLYANHASNALVAKQPGALRFTSGGYVELSAEI